MSLFNRKPKGDALIDEGHRSLLEEARARFRAAAEAENTQRELELDDLKFCDPAAQWPEEVRLQRDAEGRPCLTVDRLNPFVHQVVNETRQNRPQPQVNPVGDGADKDTAEILQGMIRHIAYLSNGDVAIDTAFESMVRCGRGYFRVLTDYCDEKSFEQDIVIKRVVNPHMVYLDPAFSEPDGSDAEWGFIGTYVPRAIYRAEYPDSRMAGLEDSTWESIGDTAPEWAQKDGAGCLVVEYFRRVRKPVTVYLLEDGSTTKEKPESFKDKRASYEIEVEWFKLNAIEVLDKTIWPGKWIPIVPVLGSELSVDGQRTWSGMVRSAKDAQRAFNYWKSAQAETIALAPRAPWVGPKGFMGSGSQKAMWQQANRRPVAALEYEAYDNQQRPMAPPQRTMVEPPIMAITQAMVGAVDDLKATTGIYDPSLGNRESSQSGVAIRQLQRQGQTGNFHFQDNLARSIRHLGRIMVDLIPKVYDTQRMVRIIHPDESVDTVTINGPSGKTDQKTGLEKVYDLSVGTYDVTVNVGPGYQTKRQENLALLESLMQGPMGGMLTQVAPDLVASMMDFQIAPKLVERLKKILPPALQDQPEGGPQGGPQIPPEVQAQMQQEGQMVQQLTERVHQLTDALEDKQGAEQTKVQAEMARAQLDAQTRLEIARMNNETDLIKTQATLDAKGANEQIAAKLNGLEQTHQDLQDLVLAMSDNLMREREEPQEPEEPKVDPVHQLLEGHRVALEGIGKALKRLGGPKKVVMDETGAPIGVAPVDEDEEA